MGDVSLKEYFEKQFEWLNRYFESKITGINESVLKAAVQIDKRLESMNEFRNALQDQAGRLATKDTVESIKDSLDRRVKVLELRDAKITGIAAVVAMIVSGVVAFIVKVI